MSEENPLEILGRASKAVKEIIKEIEATQTAASSELKGGEEKGGSFEEKISEVDKARDRFVALKKEAEEMMAGKIEITDIPKLSNEVVDKFNEALGVDYEKDKDKLPLPLAFFELSEGQQLLALHNLKQFNLNRVEKSALAKKKTETEELAKTKIYEIYTKNFWKRAGLGIAREYHFKKKAHEAEKEIREDIRENLHILVCLLKSVEGVEVVKKDGELVMNFASGLQNLSSSGQKQVNDFNEAARNYLKYSYSEEVAFKKKNYSFFEKEKFLRAKEEYESLISNVRRIKQECLIKQGASPEQARFIAWNDCRQIQKTVEINRFLNAHPDVEKSLQGIESEPVFHQGVVEALKARGLYAGAGFAGRCITAGILGFAAAPVVAAGFGAFRAYKNKKLNFKEREILQRFGFEEREKAGKRSAREEADLKLRVKLGDSAAAEKIGKEKTVQRFVKAKRLSNTINVLLNRIDDIDYNRIILVTDNETGEKIEVKAADTFNKEN